MLHFARQSGWVLMLTVLMLFLFPLSSGSFTATHGPTTAMRSLMAAQTLLATIALFVSVAFSLIVLLWVSEAETPVPADLSNGSSFQLRC